jgi:hypothetical protein
MVASAVGGGGLFVPILILVVGLRPDEAIPLSQAMIARGSVAKMILNFNSVRANDAAVILCAQKLTTCLLREDLTDLKRDECKSTYGIHSVRTSNRLLAV